MYTQSRYPHASERKLIFLRLLINRASRTFSLLCLSPFSPVNSYSTYYLSLAIPEDAFGFYSTDLMLSPTLDLNSLRKTGKTQHYIFFLFASKKYSSALHLPRFFFPGLYTMNIASQNIKINRSRHYTHLNRWWKPQALTMRNSYSSIKLKERALASI